MGACQNQSPSKTEFIPNVCIDNVRGYKLYLAIARRPNLPGSNYSIYQNLHVSMHGSPWGTIFGKEGPNTFGCQNWSGGPVLVTFLPKSVGTNF